MTWCRFSTLTLLLPIVSILLITSCSRPRPPVSLTWAEHQQQVRQLTHFQIRGSLRYRAPQQTASVRFFWHQEQLEHFQLRLTTLLGQTVLTVKHRPGLTCVTDQQGQQQCGTKPRQLLKAATGLSIPLYELSRWIVGLPEGADRFQCDAQQRLLHLSHLVDSQRLQLDYLAYHEHIHPVLPAQLQLTLGNQIIKMKIDHWQLF